ncbi:PREDICTED: uncharacterized protein LOC104589317 [Nelumbo nucifera]|uniref:Uncharacterized protein LOC104589317 n=1 Tax=Nelumbo nucifera TaxID=4432 RepID=A0A1U7Z506_NELNU|nr:PREDICTED: uncharacterized protein LOC104589317 [Nelumbo nucifera]
MTQFWERRAAPTAIGGEEKRLRSNEGRKSGSLAVWVWDSGLMSYEKATVVNDDDANDFLMIPMGIPCGHSMVGTFIGNANSTRAVVVSLLTGKLRKILPDDLHNLLKISNDALDEENKRIFLDIACFFSSMGMSRESAIDLR